MELRLYDTLTREKRPFAPLDPARVRMYVCGPTVYDFAHIGNARPVIVFDVLFRLLRHIYGAQHVTYVRNITDVDDKINARAAEEYPSLPLNEAIRTVTEKTERQFHADVAALGCLSPTIEPRATEYIRRSDGKLDMITLIQQLVDNGNAYPAEGHVLFKVSSMPDYGMLSKRSLDEMIAGARVEVAPYKSDPMDFVLWKPSNSGEPAWDSPWGPGRPGWHIECSAMSGALLGKTFDIHGGGIDLIFPHHENEIAQSRCAFHTPVMANYWLHNGFLQVEGEKMSKSLGNFFTIRELLGTEKFGARKWDGDVLRFAMLQSHYRQPIDWTVKSLEQSEARLARWKEFTVERVQSKTSRALFDDVMGHLLDDLNAPGAFAIIDKIVSGEKPNDRNRYTVHKIIRLLGFKANRSAVARLAESYSVILSEIGRLSPADWSNLVGSIQRRPAMANGKLRPGTKLIAAIHALNTINAQLLPLLAPASNSDLVRGTEQEFLRRAELKEDDFQSTVRTLLAARNAARNRKDFAESDRIRDELARMGVLLKDSRDPRTGESVTTWELAR